MLIKRFNALFAASALFFALAGPAGAQETIKIPPVPVPDIAVKADGKEFSLKTILREAKVTVLHFWATWCPTCADEMPSLAEFTREVTQRGGEVVTFAMEDSSTDKIRGYLKKYGASDMSPYAVDRRDAMKTYGIRGLPTTLIVDESGKLIEKWEGERDWKREGLADELFESADTQ